MSKRVVSVLAMALVASPVWAALTADQAKCQKKAATAARSLFKVVSTSLEKCHDRVSSGALPPATDCSLEPTTATKIAKARTKIGTKLASSCSDAVLAGLVFGGDCNGLGTASAVASCFADTHEDQALGLMTTLYGPGGAVGAPQIACQKSAAKESVKYALNRLKAFGKCKDNVSAGKLPPTTDCTTEPKTALKVGKAEAKLVGKITAACPDPSVAALTFGASCTGVATTAGLTACAVGAHRAAADELIVVEYGQGAAGGAAALKQITDAAADCVRGPLARCRAGDYLLENGKIRVVVQDVQRNLFGIGQFGGQIIDADLDRGDHALERDNFEEWSVALNVENTAHYTALTIVNDGSDGQAAVLRATGVDDLLDFINPSSVLAGFGIVLKPAVNDHDLPIEVQTDYILEPGTNWVRVRTTVVNTGAAPLEMFFGEFLNGSGQVHLFQPAYGFGDALATASCPATAPNPCNFVAYGGYSNGAGVSYGYVHDKLGTSTFTTSGVTVPLLGTEVTQALINQPVEPADFDLAAAGNPGDRYTVDRWFVVGDGSVSAISDARNQIQSITTGTLAGTVTLGGSPVAGAEVTVQGSLADAPQPGSLWGATTRNIITSAVTDDAGQYHMTLAPGSYTVSANVDGAPFEGGGSSPVDHPVTITAFGTTTQPIAIPATGAIRVMVTDENGQPLPARASIVGFDPSRSQHNTQSVFFGLINNSTTVFSDRGSDGLPFGLASAIFIDPSGDSGDVPLEPGNYQVVVSRGTEYSDSRQNVTVSAGSTTLVGAEIARVTDSTGFIGSDFHVHSIESPDSQVARRDRVVNLLAEGLDFFTPSDHDIRTAYAPDIAAIPGASNLLGTLPGAEITTFDYGHFNAWPMVVNPALVNGGTVDHGGAAPAGQDFPSFGNYNLTPAQIIAAANADPGTNTVQINHVHSFFGIDSNTGLAIDTGVSPPQSHVPGAARRLDPSITNYFPTTFNALEVWIGDNRGQVYTNFLGQNAGDWFNLLNQGYRRTGVADSDNHARISGQVGMPRTFVASPSDDPSALAAIGDTLSQNVNDGRAFGSNGPIVRVRVTAASTGQDARLELGFPTDLATTDGSVQVDVDVESPTWAEFDRVEYYVNTTTICSSSNKETSAGVVPVRRYAVAPSFTQNAPADFAVAPVVVVPGHSRLQGSTSLTLSGLTQDAWIVVMVRGTDGVSKPLFPVVPNSLRSSGNTTLANLTDGNLGEDGMTALAFTNPIYVDVDGGGWTPPGVQTVPCP